MNKHTHTMHGLAALVLIGLWILIAAGRAEAQSATQNPPQLTGVVSSTEEGPMEGVLVSAQAAGSNITTTVVSDAQGRYAFPAGRLSSGRTTIGIRAVGYDMSQPREIEIASTRPATADL